MSIQHSSRSDLWYTPDHILDGVRRVLGEIDLDPASDAEANLTVRARRIITKEQDGLRCDWGSDGLRCDWGSDCGSIFLNPPGGKIGNQSKTALFWQRLMNYNAMGYISHAIFLAFSLEALQVTQACAGGGIAGFPFCVPKSRIKFKAPDGTVPTAPSHSNMIVYVPGSVDKTELFEHTFAFFGAVLNTRRHP